MNVFADSGPGNNWAVVVKLELQDSDVNCYAMNNTNCAQGCDFFLAEEELQIICL